MENPNASQSYSVTFTGAAIPLFGWGLLLGISNILIIPTPWVATSYYRWVINHLSFDAGKKLLFKGKGGDLWLIFMLTSLCLYVNYIPLPFIPLLILPISCLLWIKIIKWLANNLSSQSISHLSFSGTYAQYLGWSLLFVVSIYTIIGWAWVVSAIIRWMVRNIQGGNYHLEFTGNGWNILWRTFVVGLAGTILIPLPWALSWLFRWYFSHIKIHNHSVSA